MYFILLDSMGEFIMGETIGGTLSNGIEDVKFDSNNDVVITGYFDSPTDFDPTENEYILENPISRGACVAKFKKGYLEIKEPKEKDHITVFPNPVQNEINLSGIEIVNSEAIIYSLDGKEILRKKIVDENKIDVSELATGNYILKVITESGVYSFQIFKDWKNSENMWKTESDKQKTIVTDLIFIFSLQNLLDERLESIYFRFKDIEMEVGKKKKEERKEHLQKWFLILTSGFK